MKIKSRIPLYCLLIMITSVSTHADSYLLYEPTTASTRSDYINTLILFRHLEYEMVKNSLVYKTPEFKIKNSEFQYKVSLCRIIDLLKDKKKYINVNKIYGDVLFDAKITYIEKRQEELKAQIKEDCNVLYKSGEK